MCDGTMSVALCFDRVLFGLQTDEQKKQKGAALDQTDEQNKGAALKKEFDELGQTDEQKTEASLKKEFDALN